MSLSSILRYNAELGKRGIARAEELTADLNKLPNPETASEFSDAAQYLGIIHRELLETRHLVYLGSCKVDVQVRDHNCTVILDGKTILEGVTTAADNSTGPGTIDVCYNTSSRTQDRLIIIATSDEIISVIAHGPTLDEQRLPNISMSRSQLRSEIGAFDDLLEEIGRVQYRAELENITAHLPPSIESVYLDCALRSVPDEHLDQALALLRTGGLRAVLREDRDLAEALAIAGAVCGAAPLRAAAEGELKRQGLNPQLLDELLRLNEQVMPLIASTGDWFLPLV